MFKVSDQPTLNLVALILEREGCQHIHRLHYGYRNPAINENTYREFPSFCLQGPPLCGTKHSIECTSGPCNPCKAKRTFGRGLCAFRSPNDAIDSALFCCLAEVANVADL